MFLNDLDIPKPKNLTRVVVAMSGGVDSSVVAALMKKRGYDVIGITLQLYDHGEATHRPGSCCAGRDIRDARNVAEQIGIPHYVLDYETRFREEVIEPFIASYEAGETPVPCIECNKTVKFRDLLKFSEELGADCVVTGHYVESRLLPSGKRGMFRPSDAARDQSYFLYATTDAQLEKLRFPLAMLEKSETRRLAEEFGLKIAQKADSQDICFIPSGNYANLIEKLKPEATKAGIIRHKDGSILGKHTGIIHYTIGQRKGLGISSKEPLYVLHLDAKNGEVIVGPREYLLTKTIKLRDFNWIGDENIASLSDDGIEVFARVRSTRAPKSSRLFFKNGSIFVEIIDGEEGVAPGQACVIYENDSPTSRVLGGGTITPYQSA